MSAAPPIGKVAPGLIGGAIQASWEGDQHSDWYLNLIARPEAKFQIFRGTGREPERAERAKLWAVAIAPPMRGSP